MTDVMNNRFLPSQLKEGAAYASWRAFRDDDRSKYIGLPFRDSLEDFLTAQKPNPPKISTILKMYMRGGKDNSLWCSTSFALASNMVKSFEKWGWSVKIVGVESGGKVENLPVPTMKSMDKQN